MPMHFLGGLWLSSAIIWFFRKLDLSLKSIFYTLAGVLLIGILWEVYEILINNNFAQNPFDLPDTLSDLFFDLIGGVVGVILLSKKTFTTKENRVQ